MTRRHCVTRLFVWFGLLTGAAAGCGSSGAEVGGDTAPSGGGAAGGDATSSDAFESDAAGGGPDGALGKTDTTNAVTPVEVEHGDGAAGAKGQLIVVDQLVFPEVSEDQTQAVGFNLDGKVSDASDTTSCGKPDLISPTDGETGIDNQLSTIIPLMQLVGLGAFQTLVQTAIEEGGLLIMFQLDGVDSWDSDDEVTITMRVGQGVPLLGTNGRLLSGQTFHEKPDFEPLSTKGRVDQGVVTAKGFNTVVPVVVFGVPYELSMKDARFRATITADGGLIDGLLGGAVPMADIIAIAEKGNQNDGSILAAVESLVGGLADLMPNSAGECTAISAAIQITGVSAFMYEDYFSAAAVP